MVGRPEGLPKTGGRQTGTPNKLTAFDKAGGEDYLVRIAKDGPRTFCALLGRVLPMQLEAPENTVKTELVISLASSPATDATGGDDGRT